MKTIYLLLFFALSLASCNQDKKPTNDVKDALANGLSKDSAAKPASGSLKSSEKGGAITIAEKAAEYNSPEAIAKRKVEKFAKQGFDMSVPDACTLLSTKTVSEIMKTDIKGVEIKDGSNANSKHSRSCFWKWDDPGISNAGVMVQVMTNPVPNEVPEYLRLFIDSKRTEGEQAFNSNENYKYKNFDGFGDDGAYSHDMHKYLWRIGEEYSFMIAFNTTLQERKELAAAKKIAEEVMRNFK